MSGISFVLENQGARTSSGWAGPGMVHASPAHPSPPRERDLARPFQISLLRATVSTPDLEEQGGRKLSRWDMARCLSRSFRLALTVHRAQSSPGTASHKHRQFCLAPGRWFSCTLRLQDAPGDTGSTEKVLLHFINRDGEKFSVMAKEGESLLDVVMNHNLNIDGFGACEGTLACSTCHLIFEGDTFQQLGPVSDEELDMLDLAFGLTNTSRLGCQVRVQNWMNGQTVHVPVEVSDLRKELGVEKQSKQ